MGHKKYVVVEPEYFLQLSDFFSGKSLNPLDRVLLNIIKNKTIDDHSKILLYNKVLNSLKSQKAAEKNSTTKIAKSSPKKTFKDNTTNTRFRLSKNISTDTDFSKPLTHTQGTSTHFSPYEDIYENIPETLPPVERKREFKNHIEEVNPDFDDFIFQIAQAEAGQKDPNRLIKRSKQSADFDTFDDMDTQSVISIDKALAAKKFKSQGEEYNQKGKIKKPLKWINF